MTLHRYRVSFQSKFITIKQSFSALSLIFNIKERVRKLTRSYLAGEEGFEPSHAGIKIQCLNRLTTPQLTKSYETADEYLILPHNKLHMIEKPVGKLYLLLDEIHML